jgi:1,4-dihydroxy-2-naphthoate octaprenyltransferase
MPYRTVLQAARPSFLILTPICVFLGTSTALAAQESIDSSILLLVLIGALCAHIGVNTLNEYSDFKSGLDLLTAKTPFSGGSGALPHDPAMAGIVLLAALATITVTAGIGIYFTSSNGLLILPIGLIGLLIILTYTKWINRWPLLCLVAPGLGFGILMVVGTHVVLTGANSITAWLASLVPFFLVNNLLLLNQYPDIEADKRIGRYHFPIAYGTKASSYTYSVFSACAYLTILTGIYFGYFPLSSLVALLPALLSLFSITGAFRYGEKIGSQPKYLGANVAATLLTPLLLGISIIHG